MRVWCRGSATRNWSTISYHFIILRLFISAKSVRALHRLLILCHTNYTPNKKKQKLWLNPFFARFIFSGFFNYYTHYGLIHETINYVLSRGICLFLVGGYLLWLYYDEKGLFFEWVSCDENLTDGCYYLNILRFLVWCLL